MDHEGLRHGRRHAEARVERLVRILVDDLHPAAEAAKGPLVELRHLPAVEADAARVRPHEPQDRLAIERSRLDDSPVDAEVRRRLIRATAKVNRILRAMEEPMSLDSPVGTEDSSQLGDFIEDEDAQEPMDTAAKDLLR